MVRYRARGDVFPRNPHRLPIAASHLVRHTIQGVPVTYDHSAPRLPTLTLFIHFSLRLRLNPAFPLELLYDEGWVGDMTRLHTYWERLAYTPDAISRHPANSLVVITSRTPRSCLLAFS